MDLSQRPFVVRTAEREARLRFSASAQSAPRPSHSLHPLEPQRPLPLLPQHFPAPDSPLRGPCASQVRANAIILATGATARRLGLPRESEFWSRGISACAICDGAAPIFRQQDIAVIGGGDSATEEAVYLTKYAKHVHLVVRGEKMRASMAMQARFLIAPALSHVRTRAGTASSRGLLLFD